MCGTNMCLMDGSTKNHSELIKVGRMDLNEIVPFLPPNCSGVLSMVAICVGLWLIRKSHIQGADRNVVSVGHVIYKLLNCTSPKLPKFLAE